MSNDLYRLARITRVHPDSFGVLRTVTVGLRPQHAQEKTLPYKTKPLNVFPVGVQRLVVVLPKEEQDYQLGICNEDVPNKTAGDDIATSDLEKTAKKQSHKEPETPKIRT